MDYYPDLITNFSLIQEENDYEGVNYGITDDDNAEGDRVGGFGSTGK